MNVPLTLTVSLLAALLGTITKKFYTDRTPDQNWAGFLFNAVCSLAAAIVLLCWGGFGSFSVFTVLLGFCFGALIALQGVANLAALQCGPMSYTTVIISFSTLISALSGVFFFGETIGWAQIVGIVLMLFSFVLSTEKNGEEKNTSVKWLVLCIVSFLGNGGIGVMQKVHQESTHSGELNAFLVVAFAASTVLCALFAGLSYLKEKDKSREAPLSTGKGVAWILLAIMLVSGVCVAANHKFNLYLSGVMDSAIFFPIVNGGGLVLATLAALILFKERLSKKQWVGIVFGITSVIFLCNPFA